MSYCMSSGWAIGDSSECVGHIDPAWQGFTVEQLDILSSLFVVVVVVKTHCNDPITTQNPPLKDYTYYTVPSDTTHLALQKAFSPIVFTNVSRT